VVTEAVLTGGAAVAPAAGGSSEQGVIYKLPKQPGSGKPYIGSTENLTQRMSTRRDGRVGPAEKVDSFRKGSRDHRHFKEQTQMDKHGGKPNLDNKRNAASPQRMEKLKKKFEKE
jgi:hypothetical protein